nr:hypothetical protein [uncultured Mediterranean phage uvMED]
METKKFNREFYIFTQEGYDTWHHALSETDNVLTDYLEFADDPSFRIEIQTSYIDGADWVEIYPDDEGISDFPKYVQKQIYKVLIGIEEVKSKEVA